jgi:hypothetical protein
MLLLICFNVESVSRRDAVIDLDAFGLNGKEPEQLKMMRTLLEKEEPDLFRLVHQDDPIIKKYIGDPTLAYKEAMAAAGLDGK